MSSVPPKRSLTVPPQRPQAPFNWPPTDEEMAQARFETVQAKTHVRQEFFNWPPAQEKPERSSIEPVSPEPAGHEEPHADFNWPPPNEHSEQSTVDAAPQDESGEPGAEFYWPPPGEPAAPLEVLAPPDVLAAVQPASAKPEPEFSWPPADDSMAPCGREALPAAVVAMESTWIPADAGPAMARDDEPAMFDRQAPESSSRESLDVSPAALDRQGDAAPTQSDVVDAPPGATEGSTLSASAEHETPLDETRPIGWATEIAQLQALIDGLTDKDDARDTNVTDG